MIKINDKRTKFPVEFSELREGDFFLSYGSLYLKLPHEEEAWSLSTRNVAEFGSKVSIEPVDVEINIFTPESIK